MKARKVAFEVLLNIKFNEAYSNHALSTAFAEHELSIQDKAFVTEIVYGTLTHYRKLVFWVEPYFQGRVKEWVQVLLAMTMYQTACLSGIPSYAANNDAVEIAKQRGGNFNAKVVNSILRKATVDDLRWYDDIEDEIEKWAMHYSHPNWLVRLWDAQFGWEKTEEIMEANNEKAQMVLRTNLALTNKDALIKKLSQEGVTCTEGELCPTAIRVTKGNPLLTTAFKDGLFYIQDEASMLPAMALAPTKGAQVLDVCAAPGGKTFHLAEMVGELGVVYAHDIYDHKIARIKENAKRLRINNVEASLCCALELEKLYKPASFDYILVDAPCSGLGILRRHPEAKLSKKPEDLDEITPIQQHILGSASKLLKPGGRLVYSTCTLNRKENQRQVESFLKANEDFELDHEFEARMPAILKENFEHGMLQLFPQDFKTDGFFVASLTQKRKRLTT